MCNNKTFSWLIMYFSVRPQRLKCWCKKMMRWRWYSAEVAVLCPKQKITTDAWRTDRQLQRIRFKSKAWGFTVNVDMTITHMVVLCTVGSGSVHAPLFIPAGLCWSLILKRFESLFSVPKKICIQAYISTIWMDFFCNFFYKN